MTGLPRCSVATAHAEDPVFTEPRYAYVRGFPSWARDETGRSLLEDRILMGVLKQTFLLLLEGCSIGAAAGGAGAGAGGLLASGGGGGWVAGGAAGGCVGGALFNAPALTILITTFASGFAAGSFQ